MRSRSPTRDGGAPTAFRGMKGPPVLSKTSTRPIPTRAKAFSSASSRNELKSFLAPLDVEIVRARSNEGNMFSSTGREIWHDLAVALAVLLVFESIFATWVGRSR